MSALKHRGHQCTHGLAAYKRSEFAIINTDNPDDMPIEDIMPMEDKDGLKLTLRLHYERFPASGGAFKVQVYAPYVIYNKIGLPLNFRSKAPFSAAKAAPGQAIIASRFTEWLARTLLTMYSLRRRHSNPTIHLFVRQARC